MTESRAGGQPVAGVRHDVEKRMWYVKTIVHVLVDELKVCSYVRHHSNLFEYSLRLRRKIAT